MPILRMMTWVEETYAEGLLLDKPARKAVAMAVIKNPLADRYKDDLSELTEIGNYLGAVLAAKARNALGIKPEEVEGIGKGCIVGEAGELEHAAALMYVRYPDKGFGKAFRDETGGGLAIMMANAKIGSMNESLDIPIGYKDAVLVCTHWDTVTVNLPGAPKMDEMVVIGVITDTPRPNARIPGLRIEDVRVLDGQR
ncbi:MAG: amino acid synthesis family protein [Deltaproteobacteria bacterium]|nr:amino acid synthesis family protein [Deltaproteobacteria bacterium]